MSAFQCCHTKHWWCLRTIYCYDEENLFHHLCHEYINFTFVLCLLFVPPRKFPWYSWEIMISIDRALAKTQFLCFDNVRTGSGLYLCLYKRYGIFVMIIKNALEYAHMEVIPETTILVHVDFAVEWTGRVKKSAAIHRMLNDAWWLGSSCHIVWDTQIL